MTTPASDNQAGPTVRIRAARLDDGERLREIARHSKSYWGYPAERVDEWAGNLDFSAVGMQKKEFYVADVAGHPVAWMALNVRGDVCWLDDMWVDPEWIGKGIGTRLFDHAAARGRSRTASRMEWEAERHAVGFYEKMGGRYLRDSEPGVWGRISPIMGIELAASGSTRSRKSTSGSSG
jgi:GNAT superfamily N-acetyltransferase